MSPYYSGEFQGLGGVIPGTYYCSLSSGPNRWKVPKHVKKLASVGEDQHGACRYKAVRSFGRNQHILALAHAPCFEGVTSARSVPVRIQLHVVGW